MKLVPTSPFRRRVRRLSPTQRRALGRALRRLQADPFDPAFRAHKLAGGLAGKWAFSAAYDLRVIFLIEGDRAYLLAVGTHDEVY